MWSLRQKLQCGLIISIYIIESLPPEFKFILPLLTHFTLFLFKLHPFYVCHYTFTSNSTPDMPFTAFSQSENEDYAGLLHIHPIFLIKYCLETLSLAVIINRTIVGNIIYCATKRVLNCCLKPGSELQCCLKPVLGR